MVEAEPPGINPVPPSRKPEGDENLSKGPKGEPQKPFSLPKKGVEESKPTQPSPMDVAKQAHHNQQRWSQKQMQEHLNQLHQSFAQTQKNLESNQKKLTPEHYQAMDKVIKKTDPDLRQIALQSGEKNYVPLKKGKNETPLNYAVKWLAQGQETMQNALAYASHQKDVNPAGFLKLQYAVNRAQQRVELFSSVIGSSVSGIKTLMSTQLG